MRRMCGFQLILILNNSNSTPPHQKKIFLSFEQLWSYSLWRGCRRFKLCTLCTQLVIAVSLQGILPMMESFRGEFSCITPLPTKEKIHNMCSVLWFTPTFKYSVWMSIGPNCKQRSSCGCLLCIDFSPCIPEMMSSGRAEWARWIVERAYSQVREGEGFFFFWCFGSMHCLTEIAWQSLRRCVVFLFM